MKGLFKKTELKKYTYLNAANEHYFVSHDDTLSFVDLYANLKGTVA